MRRLINACRDSCAGFRHGVRNEAAVREGLALLAILAPVSAFLRVGAVERVMLVFSMPPVVLIEFLKTAV